MANETKTLTAEEIEKIKEEAVAAQQKDPDDSNNDGGGKKPGFKDKAKEAFDKFWNFSITPKKIATAVLIGGVAFLGGKWAYEKGKNDAMSEAEFNGQAALPDSGEPLALETAGPQAVFEATVSDFVAEEVEEL